MHFLNCVAGGYHKGTHHFKNNFTIKKQKSEGKEAGERDTEFKAVILFFAIKSGNFLREVVSKFTLFL